MLTNEQLEQKVKSIVPNAVLSVADTYGLLDIEIEPKYLPAIVKGLRDNSDLKFEMLIDIVGADYSEYPKETKERFGVIYNFKSISLGHRIMVRVWLEEENPKVGSIHDLYKNANFLEREVYDQYGVRFENHPNLKRLLNHVEFVGHPLRKDYPITRQQWLTESDDLMDEMEVRLVEKGYPK